MNKAKECLVLLLWNPGLILKHSTNQPLPSYILNISSFLFLKKLPIIVQYAHIHFLPLNLLVTYFHYPMQNLTILFGRNTLICLSAPLIKSLLTTLALPETTARCKGVNPDSMSFKFGSLPQLVK